MKKLVTNAPTCLHCEEELSDWCGNVMVDFNRPVVEEIEIWCKDCTNDLDKTGIGRKYKHIWELVWVKNEFFALLEQKVVVEDGNPFSDHAKEQLIDLGRMVYGVPIPSRDEY